MSDAENKAEAENAQVGLSEEDAEKLRSITVEADDFDDYGAVAPSRLSERAGEPDSAADESEDTEADDDEKSTGPHQRWLDRPSVADQFNRVPSSIRFEPPVTETLRLGDAAQLKRLNEIQHQAYEINPRCQIRDMERVFHDGDWYVCLTYAKILYQKL